MTTYDQSPSTTTTISSSELAICTHILTGSVSIFIWDVLGNLKDDYKVAKRFRITFPEVVYLVSRVSNAIYFIGVFIVFSVPVGNCNSVIRAFAGSLTLALPASELLLFLYLRAIYVDNRIIVWSFFLLWLGTIAGAVTASVSLPGTQTGLDNYCVPKSFSTFSIATIFIPFANNTLIYSALIWRVMRTSYQEASVKNTIMTVAFGRNMPHFARVLLQNSQLYILTTILVNLAALFLYIFDAGNPSLAFASIMVINVMASRTYRDTKLGRYNSNAMTGLDSEQVGCSIVFTHSTHSSTGSILPHTTVAVPSISNIQTINDSQSFNSDSSHTIQTKTITE